MSIRIRAGKEGHPTTKCSVDALIILIMNKKSSRGEMAEGGKTRKNVTKKKYSPEGRNTKRIGKERGRGS